MLTFCLFVFFTKLSKQFLITLTQNLVHGTWIVTFGKSRFLDDLSLCDFADMLFSSIVIRMMFLVVCETYNSYKKD